jgi:hypothetical protein
MVMRGWKKWKLAVCGGKGSNGKAVIIYMKKRKTNIIKIKNKFCM